MKRIQSLGVSDQLRVGLRVLGHVGSVVRICLFQNDVIVALHSGVNGTSTNDDPSIFAGPLLLVEVLPAGVLLGGIDAAVVAVVVAVAHISINLRDGVHYSIHHLSVSQ